MQQAPTPHEYAKQAPTPHECAMQTTRGQAAHGLQSKLSTRTYHVLTAGGGRSERTDKLIPAQRAVAISVGSSKGHQQGLHGMREWVHGKEGVVCHSKCATSTVSG
jgi:hypothetical protein